MSPEPISDQDQRGTELPAQLTQEVEDLRCGDIGLGMEAEVEVDPIAVRGHAQGGDDGQLLLSARALRQERSMAAGSPASLDKGSHQEAGFVQEDEAGLQAGGFFSRGATPP